MQQLLCTDHKKMKPLLPSIPNACGHVVWLCSMRRTGAAWSCPMSACSETRTTTAHADARTSTTTPSSGTWSDWWMHGPSYMSNPALLCFLGSFRIPCLTKQCSPCGGFSGKCCETVPYETGGGYLGGVEIHPNAEIWKRLHPDG
jgi:hypothetical protein